MTGRLDGVVALVTGASSGIGAATARALAAEGATVAALARRRERLEALVAGIGGGASAHEADLTDDDAVLAAVADVVERHGRIDVLVNNAGYGSMVPARAADLAQWRAMIDVNVTGVLAVTHAALEHLVDAAGGPRGVADVVTISSVAGRKVSAPAAGVYAASKHAVGAFSEGLRQELAEHHVRVGLVEPGLVRTELTEGGGGPAVPDSALGILEAEDIADAVVYMVTRPPRTAVNEMLVRPIEQVR